MIITRETDYAIRILRSLADLQLKNIREISDEQLVPRQFAYKISKKLERAGFGSLTLAIKENRCEASKMAYFFVNFSIFSLSNV